MAVLVGCLSSSCSSEEESLPQHETTSATFSIGIDAQTRAKEPLSTAEYNAKMYLFEGKEENGTISYSYNREVEITQNDITDGLKIDGLAPDKKYKAVFLARSKEESLALPTFSESKPSYNEAKVDYINNAQTDWNIFRSVESFVAGETKTTVLTRQNGALEVRLKNLTGVTSLTLHAKGHKTMYLQDGTGGMVITDGDDTRVDLATSLEKEDIKSQEVRIRLNLLPQEDITSSTIEEGFYLELSVGNTSYTYPIKSDQKPIPIYPNQVTWLTLGSLDGFFDVHFGEEDAGIDLDDNIWDGWHDEF